MNDSLPTILGNLWKRSPWSTTDKIALDTVTGYVQDTEHDLLSIITALQANVELLRDEQMRNHLSVDRFIMFSRAISRLISDITAVASVSTLASASPSKKRHLLTALIEEISAETREEFKTSQDCCLSQAR
jgi:hypothetical protein